MNKVGKLAVVGDRDSVTAFKAVGAEVFSPQNIFEAQDTLKMLVKEDYAVVFVTEDIAVELSSLISKLKLRPYPAIIPIPPANGTNGFGMNCIKKDVERAIGADILFNKDK